MRPIMMNRPSQRPALLPILSSSTLRLMAGGADVHAQQQAHVRVETDVYNDGDGRVQKQGVDASPVATFQLSDATPAETCHGAGAAGPGYVKARAEVRAWGSEDVLAGAETNARLTITDLVFRTPDGRTDIVHTTLNLLLTGTSATAIGPGGEGLARLALTLLYSRTSASDPGYAQGTYGHRQIQYGSCAGGTGVLAGYTPNGGSQVQLPLSVRLNTPTTLTLDLWVRSDTRAPGEAISAYELTLATTADVFSGLAPDVTVRSEQAAIVANRCGLPDSRGSANTFRRAANPSATTSGRRHAAPDATAAAAPLLP